MTIAVLVLSWAVLVAVILVANHNAHRKPTPPPPPRLVTVVEEEGRVVAVRPDKTEGWE